jgi:hypothetical protein
MDQAEVLQARGRGELREAILTPAADANGWVIQFLTADGRQLTLTSPGGHEHIFHDLDHASQLGKELGFDEVRIEERF